MSKPIVPSVCLTVAMRDLHPRRLDMDLYICHPLPFTGTLFDRWASGKLRVSEKEDRTMMDNLVPDTLATPTTH